MPADYGYINARVRGMKSCLIDQQLYAELAAKPDLEGVLSSLAHTGYQVAMEAALARQRGLAALADALRRDLIACLRKIQSIVADAPNAEAARLVRILLARWDRRNLLTIVRAQSQGLAATLDMDLLVPVGGLDETALTGLARQPDLRAVIDLMSMWQLPYAAALRRAWPVVVETGRLVAIEEAVDQSYASAIQAQLEEMPASDSIKLVRQVLQWEADQVNLLDALRLRQATLRGEPLDPQAMAWYLDGGALPRTVLLALSSVPEARDVCRALSTVPAAGPWLPALAAWATHGDLTILQKALERRLTEMAVAYFRHDPLTIAPVIAYLWAKENEVRNLRIIGWGIAEGWSREQILLDLCYAGMS